MSDIEFGLETERAYLKKSVPEKEINSSLVNFLISKCIAKDVRQAEMFILISLAAIAILWGFIFYLYTGGGKAKLTPRESEFLNSLEGTRTPEEYDKNLFQNL